jgi:hypothetical protein
MKLLAKSFAGVVFLYAGVALTATAQGAGPADATTQLSKMTMAQKHQAQQYFTAHSFEFSPLFKRYHPGPYWILAKTKQFKLTAAQTRQQEDLKNAMAKATIEGNIGGAFTGHAAPGYRCRRPRADPAGAGDGAVSPGVLCRAHANPAGALHQAGCTTADCTTEVTSYAGG